MSRIALLGALLAALLASRASSNSLNAAPNPSYTAITNVRVVDPVRGRTSPPSTILIRNARIAAVLPWPGRRIPAGAQLIEGKGLFAIPGLWDMHVHALNDPDDAVSRTLPLFVSYGVTGVRDMGSTLAGVGEVRRRLAADPDAISPTLYVSGPVLDGKPKPWLGALQALVRTSAEAEAELLKLRGAGVDFLKTYDDLQASALALVQKRSAQWRLPLAGHPPVSLGLSGAARAGFRSIEHLSMSTFAECADNPAGWQTRAIAAKFGKGGWSAYYNVLSEFGRAIHQERCDAAYRLMARNATWFTPTLVMELNDPSRVDLRSLDYIKGQARAWCDKTLEDTNEADPMARNDAYRALLHQLFRMRAAGVKLLAGTDTPNYCLAPGAGLHTELDRLAEAGLTPLEVLRSATSNAADAVGRSSKHGRVAKGFVANIVILRADPLRSTAALHAIDKVVVQGRVLDRVKLDAIQLSARTMRR